MDITLPLNSWVHQNNGNTVIWAISPEHTESAPYLAIFKRRPANDAGTSGYQVKVVRSHEIDSTTGERANQILELNFKNVRNQDATDAAAAYDVLAAILADADLKNKVLVTGQIPLS